MAEAIHRERQCRDLSPDAGRMAPQIPSLSLDTKRERSLIAKALFIGAKQLAADRHGQKIEAEQMKEILERQYRDEMDQLQYAEALVVAAWRSIG